MADPVNPSGADPTGTAHSGLTSANFQLTSPYAQQALGKGFAAASTPYQAFRIPGGEANASSARVASMNPMESNAYQGIAGMNFQDPMNAGLGAVRSATESQWGAGAASPYMNAYNQMVSAGNPMSNQANAAIGGMNAGTGMNMGQQLVSSAATSQFGGKEAQQYMSPYMQNVVEQQKQNAVQDWQRTQPEQQAKGFQAGAGRGSRSALLQAESQRNLQNQLGDIQAKGSQSAYENAQKQYAEDINRRMTGGQNLFGQGTDIYGKQYQAGQAEKEQQINAYNRSMDQYNADINRRMTGGQNMFNLGTDIYGKQVAGGQAQQQNKQQQLSAMYEDFLKEQGYPKEQASYMMQMLGQVPQYQDYSTKAYQTAAPVNKQTATAGGIEAIFNSLLGGG